jgi:hypothetical protein
MQLRTDVAWITAPTAWHIGDHVENKKKLKELRQIVDCCSNKLKAASPACMGGGAVTGQLQ